MGRGASDLTASALAITEPTVAAPRAPEPGPASSQTATLTMPPPTSTQTAPVVPAAHADSQTAPTEPEPAPLAGRAAVTQPDMGRAGPPMEAPDDSDTQPQLPPVDPLLHPAPGTVADTAPSLGDVLGHDTAPDLDASLLRPQGSSLRARSVESAESALLLRALTELLIEKGLLTRDEVVERLRRLSAAKATR